MREPALPAASEAVTVIRLVPTRSGMFGTCQLVVPCAAPPWPNEFDHLTLTTPTLSAALPLRAIEEPEVKNTVRLGERICTEGGVVSATPGGVGVVEGVVAGRVGGAGNVGVVGTDGVAGRKGVAGRPGAAGRVGVEVVAPVVPVIVIDCDAVFPALSVTVTVKLLAPAATSADNTSQLLVAHRRARSAMVARPGHRQRPGSTGSRTRE